MAREKERDQAKMYRVLTWLRDAQARTLANDNLLTEVLCRCYECLWNCIREADEIEASAELYRKLFEELNAKRSNPRVHARWQKAKETDRMECSKCLMLCDTRKSVEHIHGGIIDETEYNDLTRICRHCGAIMDLKEV